MDMSLMLCDKCKSQVKLCDCGCGKLMPKYAQNGIIRKFKDRAHSAHHHRTGKKATAETRYKLSIASKKRYEDPEVLAAFITRMTGRRNTPDTLEKMRKSARRRWEDPQEHENARNGQKERYKNPEAREVTRLAMVRRYEDPEERRLTSISVKRWMRENDITLRGATNPNWRGGIQYGEYDEKFNDEFKESIRKRQNYHCADEPLGNCSVDRTALHVHHIDRNKKNTTLENCIALCNSHHMHSHNKTARSRHRKYIEEICEIYT